MSDETLVAEVSPYREGLALAQLSPGPLAAQLAMYLGLGAWWRRRRGGDDSARSGG